MVTLVSDDRKTFDVVNINNPKEVHRGIKVDSGCTSAHYKYKL